MVQSAAYTLPKLVGPVRPRILFYSMLLVMSEQRKLMASQIFDRDFYIPQHMRL